MDGCAGAALPGDEAGRGRAGDGLLRVKRRRFQSPTQVCLPLRSHCWHWLTTVLTIVAASFKFQFQVDIGWFNHGLEHFSGKWLASVERRVELCAETMGVGWTPK
eukprot:1203220-Rhodomonas_salina.4